MLSFVIVLRHADKVRHPADHLLHLFLVLLVGFLPLGVFKFIPCTCPMDVGDVLANHFILPCQFIDLIFQFALASLHTEEQSVGNGLLHTVKVGLERRINQIDIPVSCTSNFFFVEIFYLHAFLFGFLHLLPLRLFGGDTGGIIRFTLDLLSLNRTLQPDLRNLHCQ